MYLWIEAIWEEFDGFCLWGVYLGFCLKIYWIHQFMAIYIAENMIIYDNQSVVLTPFSDQLVFHSCPFSLCSK